MKTITKENALKEGFTLCGFEKLDYQSLMNIADLSESEIGERKLFLADKESDSPSISAESIREMLAETIESDWGNDTSDDTEEVYKTIMKLDFQETAKMVNDALSKIKCYKLTNIQLTTGQ